MEESDSLILKVCGVCGVRICDDVVMFSHGNYGTKSRLWARVCQFTKRDGCINTPQEIRSGDAYSSDVEIQKLIDYIQTEN